MKEKVNLLVNGSVYLKVEDVMTEDDEVLDEVIDQGGVQHQVPARGDGAQGGAETDRQVVTVHLGLLTEPKFRKYYFKASCLPELRQIMKKSKEISGDNNVRLGPILNNNLGLLHKI